MPVQVPLIQIISSPCSLILAPLLWLGVRDALSPAKASSPRQRLANHIVTSVSKVSHLLILHLVCTQSQHCLELSRINSVKASQPLPTKMGFDQSLCSPGKAQRLEGSPPLSYYVSQYVKLERVGSDFPSHGFSKMNISKDIATVN